MSVSTDGQICYGIYFGEGFSFPWEKYSEYKWWRKVNGYKRPFDLYTEGDADYIGGVRPPQQKIDEYWEHCHQWEEVHPFPVKLVNYCSGDYPMYILAVPESVISNSRGCPQEFDPAKLQVTEEQKQSLIDFCEKYLGEAIEENNSESYNEKIELKPAWFLSSYWG